MNRPADNLVMRNSTFGWIALATCVLLLVPLVAMQFTAEVSWSAMDFVVMGCLLFVTGSLFVLVARKLPRRYWIATGALFASVLLYVWAELAVGVFTHLGR